MAGNTKSIVKDVDAKPAPQYFNPIADAYEYLLGRNGANRVELYGPDGNPISTTSGKLDVRASEIETLLATLGSKDFATQTTLAAVLAKLSADPATQTTLAAILAKTDLTLSALRDALRGVDSKTISDLVTLLTAMKDTAGIKKITDTVNVELTGSIPAGTNSIGKIGFDSTITQSDLADSDIVVPAGTTYSFPGVPIGDIDEIRVGYYLQGLVKHKINIRHDRASTPANALGDLETLVDNSASAKINGAFIKTIRAGLYYILQFVNADTVDATIVYWFERRVRRYA